MRRRWRDSRRPIVEAQQINFRGEPDQQLAIESGDASVLQPYKMIKDHRTGHEVGNTQAVLDGRLDDFMEAYLRFQVGDNSSEMKIGEMSEE